MRDAFGIKEDFPEGSSFKEEHQKQRREAEKLEREAKYKEKEKQKRRWKFCFLKFVVITVKKKPTGNLSTLYPTAPMLGPNTSVAQYICDTLETFETRKTSTLLKIHYNDRQIFHVFFSMCISMFSFTSLEKV